MKVTLLSLLVLAALSSVAPAQEPFVGETLISPRTMNDSYLIDMDLNVIKTWHGAFVPAGFAYMLPDRSILRPCADPNGQFPVGSAGGRIQWIDANDNVIWDFLWSNYDHQHHHDIEPMPNGNVLIVSWERKTYAEAIASGRQTLPVGAEMWPTLIVEVEPVGLNGGNVVWEWHLWDHLVQEADSLLANYGVVADHPELMDINWGAGSGDWDHANAVDYNPELDQVTFSSRKMNEFYVIDHSTTIAEAAGHTGGNSGKGGDILYRWGNPQVYHRGDASDRYYFGVHGVRWIDPLHPGEGNFLTFNNGNRVGTVNDYSSVEEIVPPIDESGNYIIEPGQPFGPAAPIWEFHSGVGFYSQNKGGVFRLPNGNTLITESNDNRIFEVTPAGVNVWAYQTPGECHRAPRYWVTTSDVSESTRPGARLRNSYPNPFNPTTTISYTISMETTVQLLVFDVTGRLVKTLVNGWKAPGEYEVGWDGHDDSGRSVASGVYFYRLETSGGTITKRMVLIK